MRSKPFLLAAILWLSQCSLVNAEIVYSLIFRPTGSSNTSENVTLSLNPGEVLNNVQVILRESVTAPDSSLFQTRNLSAYTNGISATGSNGSFSNFLPDTTGFDFTNSNSNTFALGILNPNTSLGRTATTAFGGREVILGTVSLTSPTSGTTTFRLFDTNPNGRGQFAVGLNSQFLVIDEVGPTASPRVVDGTLAITAVPEPCSAFLVGIFALGLMQKRLRRTSCVAFLSSAEWSDS